MMTRKDLEKLYTAPQLFTTDNEDYHTPLEVSDGYLIPNLGTGRSIIIESLNLQTSKYHQETLMDHVAMVTGRMSCSNDHIAATIGLLHDLGKKYTIKINKVGDICFYGHEAISAKIAEQLLANNDKFSEEDKKIIVNVITVHLQPKLLKGITLDCFYEGFKQLYGEISLNYLKMLNRADRGVTEHEIGSYMVEKEISDGYDYIDLLLKKYF